MAGRETPVAVLKRWEDHGAQWRPVAVEHGRAIVDLCTCYGGPVDRLESDDPEFVSFVETALDLPAGS